MTNADVINMMDRMDRVVLMLDGSIKYYDKDYNEIFSGDMVKFADGVVRKIHETIDGELGIDATNPERIACGLSHECEYGIYPLNENDLEYAIKVG